MVDGPQRCGHPDSVDPERTRNDAETLSFGYSIRG